MPTIVDKIKDPDAILDYFFDWSEWLDASGNDTIISTSIISDTGITVDLPGINDDSDGVTVWVSGGTVARGYNITNRINTAGGRTDDRTLRLTIAEK